jgi:hypothetical protein
MSALDRWLGAAAELMRLLLDELPPVAVHALVEAENPVRDRVGLARVERRQADQRVALVPSLLERQRGDCARNRHPVRFGLWLRRAAEDAEGNDHSPLRHVPLRHHQAVQLGDGGRFAWSAA